MDTISALPENILCIIASYACGCEDRKIIHDICCKGYCICENLPRSSLANFSLVSRYFFAVAKMGKCKTCGVISRPDDRMCRRCGLVGEFQRERIHRADVMLLSATVFASVYCTDESKSPKKIAWYCNHCQTAIQVAICLDISIAARHLRACSSASVATECSNFTKVETVPSANRKFEDRVRKVFSIVHIKKMKTYNFSGL
jgi:hypothetical protein